METESVVTGDGSVLLVKKRALESAVEIIIYAEDACSFILHWGVVTPFQADWVIPPESSRPEGTTLIKNSALQTPFLKRNGKNTISIRFDFPNNYQAISFALFFPGVNRWDSNGGRNYSVGLPVPERKFSSPIELLKSMGGELLHEREYREGAERIAVRVSEEEEGLRVCFATAIPGTLKLHWGISKRGAKSWSLPSEKFIESPSSETAGASALQTPFTWKEGFNQLSITIRAGHQFTGLFFLLKSTEPERWHKNGGRDFYAPLTITSDSESPFDSVELSELAESITDAEMNRNSWTLMHRFDLCTELLESPGNSRKRVALLFVWLRFSAIRQLDWQRQYNTQPRALAHSQDRLTRKIADEWKTDRENRNLFRLLLTTLGPGGEGQKIRDEILNIMHRHRIKEVSGHFMEEWHQKLHNNTTPDDIVICEAFLEFLRSDGNLGLFYDTLKRGGVDRERLRSFDRPIVTDPDFVPHLKHALIHDFENYLRLFRSVHTGSDLEAAIGHARGYLDHGMNGLLSAIWGARLAGSVVRRVGLVTDARDGIGKVLLAEQNSEKIRSLLYLDLALEELLRKIIEGNIHLGMDRNDLVHLVGLCLKNICITGGSDEFNLIFKHWRYLSERITDDSAWALAANSVLERTGRVTGEYLDTYYGLFQPVAEALGRGFNAEEWSIACFGEEILRGHPAFVLSSLIHHLDPLLRKAAKLGEWQVVSRGEGEGYIRFYETLRSIQGKHFDKPAVLLVNEVKGDEDIPEGVTAVITPDAVDLVSHVAVRVRNTGILFATCYNDSLLSDLRKMENSLVGASVSNSGDVTVSPVKRQEAPVKARQKKFTGTSVIKRGFSEWVLRLDEVSSETAGGKSLHLAELRKGLPDWLTVPESVVIPFSVFDRILDESGNSARYKELLSLLETVPDTALSELLALVKNLPVHGELISSLIESMERAGFSEEYDSNLLWSAVTGVWASVWSGIAFESRKNFGFPHGAVSMAVLVQRVVPADYAFVIHTVNPVTGSADEIFAEVVPGLGETLVGSHPGRAFGFSSEKSGKGRTIISFPSKSHSLRGGGIICRSDSNAEDLGNYSGAGLYDSILLDPPESRLNDYLTDPLATDVNFRDEIMGKITETGVIVEKFFNSPQDIEGVYSDGRWYLVQARPQTGTG